ncbi:hypothetical protein RRG08_062409 [Elysia crispata]|uniref:Uncharacterized protein n=1 Tax=Elysia crispata TaxID=231223 RepID=A0AAE1BD12_9GAST|nr:hypothetical protein RRG08_062409 [Elysia crispata]
MNQYRNPTGLQSNFTFTAPTQCTTLGTPRPCIETISPINLSAPGVGASWQHSIPTTMPWVDMNSAPQNVPLGSATVFTGVPFNIYSGQVSSNNSAPRRSKRKAHDVPAEAPISKVHLCADQLANMRITPNHHTSPDTTSQFDLQTENICVDYDTRLDIKKPTNKAEDWERFRELESRLTADSDEEVDQSHSGVLRKKGVQLHVNDCVINVAQNSSPILPRKVMEDINKPCMQIVLWQSPEKLIRDITNDDSNAGSQSLTKTSTTTTSSHSTASFLKSTASSISVCPPIIAPSLPGSSRMETMPSEHIFDPSRSNIIRNDVSSLSTAFNRQINPACRLAPSPNFLRPLTSFTNSPFLSTTPSSNIAPVITNQTTLNTSHSNDYLNNNNVFSNNNNLSNVMDVLDSVDDEMQL